MTAAGVDPDDIDPTRVYPSGIDADMKRCQWLCWKEIVRDGKATKAPLQPDNPTAFGKSSSAMTWASFDTAREAAEGRDMGVGFPFAQASPFVAIDIDIPDDDPEGESWIPDLARLEGAVVELSPSGNYRVLLRDVSVPDWWTNQAPDGPDTREVKLFDESGYVTITGDVVDGSGPPIEATPQESFTYWLKKAWDAFHPDATEDPEDGAETPPWLTKDTPPGSGRDGATSASGAPIGIYDVLSSSAYPEGERREHPYHGSSTGTNFMVSESGETFRCWRHDITGNANHLMGMDVGVIECGDWDGGLDTATWRTVFDTARDAGYDLPEREVAMSDRSELDLSPLDDLPEPSETAIDPVKLLDARDVNDWSPSSVLGTSLLIRGQVSKRSEQQIRYENVAFVCTECYETTMLPQSGDEISYPSSCDHCEDGEYFERDGDATITADYQRIRLQELPEHSGTATGDSIDLDLLGGHVDTVMPGDRIIVEAAMEAEHNGKSRTASLYGTASGIHPLQTDLDDIDVEPYLDDIEAIAAGDHPEYPDDSPFDLLMRSIAPYHEGDESVKKAVMYVLFGGGGASDGSLAALGGGTRKRNTIHLLLIGDPATNKSGLLSRVRELMPRGIYTSGKGASAAGLTATATQDQFGDGGWTLEAGALVRADGGIACVDELDKMEPGDRDGLLECMSEQQVSVAKAGMNSTFPARTAVFAAANPENGHFSDYTRVAEEVNISSPVISRFDLRFVMRDEHDEESDAAVAERMNAAQRAHAGDADPDIDQPLSDGLIRAYIQHAKTLSPALTDEAADQVISDYIDIRAAGDDVISALGRASPRSINAIHSIAEASARIRLSEDIEVEDIDRATAIQRAMMANLNGTGIADDIGGSDRTTSTATLGESSDSPSRSTHASAMSQHERLQYVHRKVGEIADRDDGAEHARIADIIDECEAVGMKESQIIADIGKLGEMDQIYEPVTGEYRLL